MTLIDLKIQEIFYQFSFYIHLIPEILCFPLPPNPSVTSTVVTPFFFSLFNLSLRLALSSLHFLNCT